MIGSGNMVDPDVFKNEAKRIPGLLADETDFGCK